MCQVDVRLAMEGHRPALKGDSTVVRMSEMSQALCLPAARILSHFLQVDIQLNGRTVRGQEIER